MGHGRIELENLRKYHGHENVCKGVIFLLTYSKVLDIGFLYKYIWLICSNIVFHITLNIF